jgi:hypothetical protein
MIAIEADAVLKAKSETFSPAKISCCQGSVKFWRL